jgi:hypothetical protein
MPVKPLVAKRPLRARHRTPALRGPHPGALLLARRASALRRADSLRKRDFFETTDCRRLASQPHPSPLCGGPLSRWRGDTKPAPRAAFAPLLRERGSPAQQGGVRPRGRCQRPRFSYEEVSQTERVFTSRKGRPPWKRPSASLFPEYALIRGTGAGPGLRATPGAGRGAPPAAAPGKRLGQYPVPATWDRLAPCPRTRRTAPDRLSAPPGAAGARRGPPIAHGRRRPSRLRVSRPAPLTRHRLP